MNAETEPGKTDKEKLAMIDEIMMELTRTTTTENDLVRKIVMYWQDEMITRKRIEKKELKAQRHYVLNSPLLTYESFERTFEGQDREEIINRIALAHEHYKETQEISGEVNFFLQQVEDVKTREFENEDARQPLIEQCTKAYNDKVLDLINHIHPPTEDAKEEKQD